MKAEGTPPAACRYEIRLAGHLDARWSTWFHGLALDRHADGTTTLRGAVTDQAELHGLLARVRDVGATLVSVTRLGQGLSVRGRPVRSRSSSRPTPDVDHSASPRA